MEEAWLMLLQPYSELVTREVIGHREAEGHGDVQIPSRWNKLVQEFHDVFDPPGMPVYRDTVHHIELFPMLNLTTDACIGCLQLIQQMREGKWMSIWIRDV